MRKVQERWLPNTTIDAYCGSAISEVVEFEATQSTTDLHIVRPRPDLG